MNPDEIEFLGENQQVSIIPTFNSSVIHLISGDVGPFRAGLPMNVPLWVAIKLKEQRRCKIQPPAWMDVKELETLREQEKLSRTFVKLPSDHYMVETKLLLGSAADDIPKGNEIRTIVKDIWDFRMSKIRSSVNTLVKNGGLYAAIDNLTLIEVNSMRPLLLHVLDQIYSMKIPTVAGGYSQNTTLSLLNTSTSDASTV